MSGKLVQQILLSVALTLTAVTAFAQNPPAAYQESTIYNFDYHHGAIPTAGLVEDAAGNLYGTASEGGQYSKWCAGGSGCGVVFKLIPSKSGFSYFPLYTFCSQPNCSDGAFPAAGLVLDAKGNLYGTAPGYDSPSVVFELSPAAGEWKETVLHTFCSEPKCADGSGSGTSGVVFDKGNLYGAANSGGAYNKGVIYELSPGKNGWTETVLYNFGENAADDSPSSTPVLDSLGNIYGVMANGGAGGQGAVYELSKQSGDWQENIIYSFTGGTDGGTPGASPILDSKGNVYGTTWGGGDLSCGTKFGCGVVYQLSPSTNGGWTETVLQRFDGSNGYKGEGITFDATGNLFGTTLEGGDTTGCVIYTTGCGVVFELTPQSSGHWLEHILYEFTGETDGGLPASGVTIGPSGNLFGTAEGDPERNNGAVFELEKQ